MSSEQSNRKTFSRLLDHLKPQGIGMSIDMTIQTTEALRFLCDEFDRRLDALEQEPLSARGQECQCGGKPDGSHYVGCEWQIPVAQEPAAQDRLTEECPSCAKAWADAKAEWEAGGSPQSPPIQCAHRYKPTEPAAAPTVGIPDARAIAEQVNERWAYEEPQPSLVDAIASALRDFALQSLSSAAVHGIETVKAELEGQK